MSDFNVENNGKFNEIERIKDSGKSESKVKVDSKDDEVSIFDKAFEDFKQLENPTEQQRNQFIADMSEEGTDNQIEKMKLELDIDTIENQKNSLKDAFSRIENPTDQQKNQYAAEIASLNVQAETSQMRLDAFFSDEASTGNEELDELNKNFNLKLNELTGKLTSLENATEQQMAQGAALIQNVFEDYINDLNAMGIDTTSGEVLEAAQKQLSKAQCIIEVSGLNNQINALENKFKSLENPTDQQKEEYKTDMKVLEEEYKARKELFDSLIK